MCGGSVSYQIEEAVRSEIEIVGKARQKRRFYYFRCDKCSLETVKCPASSLKTRKSRLCRRCSNGFKLEKARIVGDCNRRKPYESLFERCLYSANRKGIGFNLSYEEFLNFVKIRHCHYCGEKVEWSKFNLKKNGYRFNLDRKDSFKGYEEGNLVVCCWRCNEAKGNRFSYEEWYGMTEYFRKR